VEAWIIRNGRELRIKLMSHQHTEECKYPHEVEEGNAAFNDVTQLVLQNHNSTVKRTVEGSKSTSSGFYAYRSANPNIAFEEVLLCRY
jgi:hypothetical protein